jgi:hypothetical protein
MRLDQRSGIPLVLSVLAAGCDLDLVPVFLDEDPPTVGEGSCRSMPLPRTCFRDVTPGVISAACIFGPDGNALRTIRPTRHEGPPMPSDPSPTPPADDSLQILENGCVGGMIVLAFGAQPDLAADGAARASTALLRVRGVPCCAEVVPNSRVPHLLTFDPVSRALIVRTAEPVQGPTQVAMFADFAALFGPIGRGYVWRFYVGGVPVHTPSPVDPER